MDHTMIAAPLAANDTNATNATNASNASNASIATLQRMIKEPDHECDADQLLPGDANPGLVEPGDPPNVHTTPSTSAIMTASDAAALAAKEALQAAEFAKEAAEAVKAAEKSR